MEVPHPDPDRTAIETGLIDPSCIWLLVATAVHQGVPAPGNYVGLVYQEFATRWIGLAGFFMPYCPVCDEDGARAEADLRALLARLNILALSASELPPGLQPRRGWFDPDRILFAGPVVDHPELDWEWHTGPLRLRHGDAALLRVGPVHADLRGLVLLEDPSSEYPWLSEHLRADEHTVTTWSWRLGRLRALASLAPAPPDPPSLTSAGSPSRIRADGWSVASTPSGDRRMARSKRAAWAKLPDPSSVTVLPGRRVVRATDLQRLWSAGLG